METQEQEIILRTLDLFMRYGIRSITMDDVAREMGISKKTIYRYFDNKADLVHKCVTLIHDTIKSRMEEIHQSAKNAIDELFEIDRVVREIMENHNPGVRFQLQKYYPKTYNEVFHGRKKLITKMITENIENGIRDGLYRKDLEPDIVTHLYCSKVETLPDEEEELITKYDMKPIMRQALLYHIRGIASDKGLKYLEQKLKSENE
ncbi:MAG: TetR/AcrR family transcriptional regulator [Owenweeksia sp.]